MVLNTDRMSRPIFLTANGSAEQWLVHTAGAGLGNKVFFYPFSSDCFSYPLFFLSIPNRFPPDFLFNCCFTNGHQLPLKMSGTLLDERLVNFLVITTIWAQTNRYLIEFRKSNGTSSCLLFPPHPALSPFWGERRKVRGEIRMRLSVPLFMRSSIIPLPDPGFVLFPWFHPGGMESARGLDDPVFQPDP
jgi:hypothetical protein